jgi:sarcosine oxidase subunit alpha
MKGNAWRLETGGRIDRSRPLAFEFDGKRYWGFAGDTLASALLANGVRIVERSFKLHRLRGLVGAWCEEPNAIVQVGAGERTVPNLKATQVELRDGLTARSVNCWPNARPDIFAPLRLFGRLMAAGFCYKTFMWPSWHWFEPAIRRAAGLGVAPTQPDPDRYEERHEHCDVLVVGGGPAGLVAALAATRAGARVVLVDDRPVLGGALQWEAKSVSEESALDWVASVERELRAAGNTRVLTRTTAFGYYDHNLVALSERLHKPEHDGVRERLWHVRAPQVVLASGSIERPMVFSDNDLPGVMLASAAVSYAVRPGRRVVLMTSGDSAYEAAGSLQARGIEVASIVDTRPEPGEVASTARRAGITVLTGHIPMRALGGHGVRAIEVQPFAGVAPASRKAAALRVECDLVCVSGGWTPTVHLFSQARGQLRYDAEHAALIPAASPKSLRCAGAAAGNFALHHCLSDGFAAGREAAKAAGAKRDAGRAPLAEVERAATSPFWAAPRNPRRKAWVPSE